MSVLEVVRRIHVYNQWADEQMLQAMDGLANEDLAREAPVAFGSLRGSLWHHLGAQLGWLGICAGYDTWSKLNVSDSSSVGGLRELFDGSHRMWREFIESMSEEDTLAPADRRANNLQAFVRAVRTEVAGQPEGDTEGVGDGDAPVVLFAARVWAWFTSASPAVISRWYPARSPCLSS